MSRIASTFRRAGLVGLCVVLALVLVAILLAGLGRARPSRAAGASTRNSGTWENAGVYGGWIFNTAIAASGRLYIALNSMPGLYYSDNNGDLWVPIELYEGNGKEVRVHEQGAVYGLLDSLLVRSTDGGTTWTNLADQSRGPWAITIHDFDVQPGDPDHIVIGTNPVADHASAFVTWDAGTTWITSTIPVSSNARTFRTVFDPSQPDGDIVYALVENPSDPWEPQYIYRSDDGGLNYTAVFTAASLDYIGEIAVTPAGTLLVGVNSGLYRSTDMVDWQKVLTNANTITLRVGIGNPVPIYTPDSVSYDDGLTWQPHPYGVVLGQSRHNPELMFRKSWLGIERTTDGGETWVETITGIEGVDTRKVGTDPFDNQILYFTSFPGAGRSLDGGNTWKFPLTEFTLTGWGLGIDPTQSGTLYIGDYPGIVYKSTDYGDSWSSSRIDENLGVSVFDLAVDPYDNQRVYVALMGTDPATFEIVGGVYYSHDGGATWNPTSISDIQANIVRAGSMVTGSIVYAGIGDGNPVTPLDGIHRSMDGGVTWEKLPLPDQPISTLAVHPVDARTVLVSLSSPLNPEDPSNLYRSMDAGNTWEPLPFYQYANEIVFDQQNPQILYILAGSMIYKSTDGGNSFVEFYNARPGEQLTSLYIPNLPPSPPADLSAYPVEGSIVLTWTNPIDLDFTGVNLRMLTDTFPTAHAQGILLTLQMGDPGSPGVFTHTGVLTDTTYFYSLFAFDDEGRFSTPSMISATLGISGTVQGLGYAGVGGSKEASAGNQILYLTTSNGIFRYTEALPEGRKVYLPLIRFGQ